MVVAEAVINTWMCARAHEIWRDNNILYSYSAVASLGLRGAIRLQHLLAIKSSSSKGGEDMQIETRPLSSSEWRRALSLVWAPVVSKHRRNIL
jgi:hypothetical protein